MTDVKQLVRIVLRADTGDAIQEPVLSRRIHRLGAIETRDLLDNDCVLTKARQGPFDLGVGIAQVGTQSYVGAASRHAAIIGLSMRLKQKNTLWCLKVTTAEGFQESRPDGDFV
jgi:hypothetical protein